jgi:hypothetical protein
LWVATLSINAQPGSRWSVRSISIICSSLSWLLKHCP